MDTEFPDLDSRNDFYHLSANADHFGPPLTPLEAGDASHIRPIFLLPQSLQTQAHTYPVPSEHGRGSFGRSPAFVDDSAISHGAWAANTSDLLSSRRESVLYGSPFGSLGSMNDQHRGSIRSEDASPLTPSRDSASTHARPHAAVEQKYRRTLNSKLQQLNSSIPMTGKFAPPTDETTELRPDNEKPESAAKPAVLDKAIQYVTHLVETYHKYEDDIEALREQVRDWLGDDECLHDQSLDNKPELLTQYSTVIAQHRILKGLWLREVGPIMTL
ncbi:hypothetical protein AC579_2960 [Pseudocercospora musae]|uniref:BHLH domain-containing protein n=1 Tax=Pseudocercospora musae TaxID=113226 RepID=A0A139I6J5_9PEZI|nr:hypothetical protein AC579_2960 [Pseudocercospora musae]